VEDDGTGNQALKVQTNPEQATSTGKGDTLTIPGGQYIMVEGGHLYEYSCRVKFDKYVAPEEAVSFLRVMLQQYDYATVNGGMSVSQMFNTANADYTVVGDWVELKVPIRVPVTYEGPIYLMPRVNVRTNFAADSTLTGWDVTAWFDDFSIREVGFEELQLEQQSALTDTPYDWNGVERELGLFYLDKTKKPVLKEITNFSEFIEKLPVDHMPERMVDPVCILNPTQDTWGTAYGAFIMAKQAGVDLKFAYTEDEIPEAKAYLLPNQTGDASLTRHVQQLLAERVRRGAKLYISMDGPLMSPFTEWTGLRVMYRGHMPHTAKVTMDGAEITMNAEYKLWCESAGAEVLAKTDDGRIAYAKNAYGEGEVYTLLYPAEMLMASVPGMTDSENAQPMYKFYEKVNMRSAEKVAAVDLPTVGLSEHILSEDKRCLMVINYEPFAQTAKLTLADGWKVAACYSAHDNAVVDGDSVVLPHNDGAVLVIEK